MCGILFYRDARGVGPGSPARSGPDLEAALEHMAPRGPDHRGLHRGDDFAIGHTRLAIIDLRPEANQPFWDAGRRHVLSYNGEIYNYRELRRELLDAGVPLRTESDTEVLLEMLLRRGFDETMARVRGMFAFCLYDTETGRLLVARDHFGQKPVYYAERDGVQAVASEVGALLALGDGLGAPDLASYSVFLAARASSGTRGTFQRDRSFFEGIHALPAGHVLEAGPGEPLRVREYWNAWSLFDPAEWQRHGAREEPELLDELEALLRQAVGRHLVADVETGVLLSGGFDSTLVYWFAQETGEALTAFTKLSPGIETLPLEVVPEALKRRPANAYLGLQRPEEYLPGLLHFIRATAAPSRWGGGVPMHRLCEAARRNAVLVLLGGDCADELMAGYGLYEKLFADPDPDPLARDELVSLDPASPFFRPADAEPFESGEREIRRRIAAALAGLPDRRERFIQATLLHDTSTFLQTISLPHSDAYSMLASVELRNPMLDLDLVRFLVNLPSAWKARRDHAGHFGKYLMRQLAGRCIGPFMYREKEGTRNYSMRMADPAYWDLSRFEVGKILPLPETLEARQLIRLFNLECFHRMFALGEEDFLPAIMTPAGLAATRS